MEAVKKYLSQRPGILLATALVSFGFFVPFHFAHAGILSFFTDLGDIFLGLLFWGPMIFIKIGMSIAVMALGFVPAYLSSLILSIVLSDKLIILPYTSGGIVDIGWNITRDLANLALIAIIIAIAVRTMLAGRGIELIPKLIGIALIINFTKVIAGVVVDIANILTNYFLEPVANFGSLALVNLFGKETPFWQLIGGSMSGQGGSLFSLDSLSSSVEFLRTNFSFSAMVGDVVGGVAMIAVGLILTFTFLVFAAIFFVRYIAIWILVIFAPLAFVAMILPETAKYARQWWSGLTKWAFMGLGPAFILFLTAKFIEKKSDLFGAYQGQIFQEAGFIQNLFAPFYRILNDLLFWAVIIIFMWIGLMLTMKMNTQVSRLMVKGGRKALGWGAERLQGREGWRLRGIGAKISESGLAKNKVFGGIFQGAGKRAVQLGTTSKERLAREEKGAKEETDDMNAAKIRATYDPVIFATRMANLKENNPDKFKQVMEEKEVREKAEKIMAHQSRANPDIAKRLRNVDPTLAAKDERYAFADDGSDGDLVQEIQYAKSWRDKYAPGTREYRDAEQDLRATTENNRKESFARHASRKTVEGWADFALKDRAIQDGLEKNKFITLAERVNSPRAFEAVLEGLGGRTANPIDELANILTKREKTFEFLSHQHLNDELVRALAKNSNLTASILTKVMREFGLDKALQIYNSMEDVKRQSGTFAKWFGDWGSRGGPPRPGTQPRAGGTAPTRPAPGGAAAASPMQTFRRQRPPDGNPPPTTP